MLKNTSMAELISRSKEFLGLTKKPRKQAHYEYSSDPVTGLRNNKGTYTGQVLKRKKELSIDSETLEHEGMVFLMSIITCICCLCLDTRQPGTVFKK